jgi:hypothetical protein
MPAPPDGFELGKTLVTNDTAEVFEVTKDADVLVT